MTTSINNQISSNNNGQTVAYGQDALNHNQNISNMPMGSMMINPNHSPQLASMTVGPAQVASISNNQSNSSNQARQFNQAAKSHTSKIISAHFTPNAATGRFEIHSDWYLTKLLGSGAYGEVHLAIEIKTSNKYAIKLDSRNNAEMEREIEFLKKLNGTSNHIPQIVEYGRYSGVSYFVMSLLGTSLSDLKKKRTPQRFSLETTLRVGQQMLKGLRAVHNLGIIHRDIKPANFVIGYKDPKIVYLIDFGLASDFNTGPERKNIGFRGTNTYASVRVHQYKDPGRIDDLVSWFYCMLRIMGMRFPWDKIKIPPKTERCGSTTINTLYSRLKPDSSKSTKNVKKEVKVAALKKERKRIQDQFLVEKKLYPLNTLLKTAESKFKLNYDLFSHLTDHLDSLGFGDEPKYDYLDQIFEKALLELGISKKDPYDWEK